MKILVYGAGVLGCNLARNLLRAGKDEGGTCNEIHRNAHGHVDTVCAIVSKTADSGVWLQYEHGKSNHEKSKA